MTKDGWTPEVSVDQTVSGGDRTSVHVNNESTTLQSWPFVEKGRRAWGLTLWWPLPAEDSGAQTCRSLLALFSLPRARTPKGGVSTPTSAAGAALRTTRLRRQPVCTRHNQSVCHTQGVCVSFPVQVKRRWSKGFLRARAALSSPSGWAVLPSGGPEPAACHSDALGSHGGRPCRAGARNQDTRSGQVLQGGRPRRLSHPLPHPA